MDRGWKTFEVCARKCQYCCEENWKGDSGENSDRDEEHAIGNWRKDDLFHKVTISLSHVPILELHRMWITLDV